MLFSRVVFLACCLITPVLGQSQVSGLLEQVGYACRKLYLHGYVADINRHRTVQQHFHMGGWSGQPGGDRFGLPIPLPPVRHDGEVDRITLARSGQCFLYGRHTTFGKIWEWRTDGYKTWCYRRDLHLYTEAQADSWPTQLGPGPGLPGDEWKYFTKFLAIADMSERAHIIRDDVPPDKSCLGPSVIVELDLSEGREPAREDLHILTHSHLPCRTVIYRLRRSAQSGVMMDSTETITWRFRNEPPHPSLFVFTPPKKSKRVKQFPSAF